MSGASTQRLLEAPIPPAIARLAAPGLALAVFQTAVSIADTHFVGRLGTDALAGLALVFPLVMLLQMTSAGAMGGGVSSAVARALGGGHLAAARRLVALFAAGMALYFASQGAGRVGVPMLAGTARLAVVALGGLIVVEAAAPLAALYGVIAFGIALFGALTGAAVHRATWEAAATSRPSSGR